MKKIIFIPVVFFAFSGFTLPAQDLDKLLVTITADSTPNYVYGDL